MSARILLTGGAGFIGSHAYVALTDAGFEVSLLDSFENAQRDVPARLEMITGAPVPVIECDIRDADAVDAALSQGFDAVVHFAARKSIPESEADPLGYYRSNVTGLLNIVEAMRRHSVPAIVFSSSAAVYGLPETMPIPEDTPPGPLNAYAETKRIGEDILARVARTDPAFRTGVLRYFNPVGAHPSGLIGEDPALPPTNLVPVMARVARGELEVLNVYGGDYPTPDGTAVRDYIHVEDLAHGHVLSLQALLERGESHLVNLGTGRGQSVLEVVEAYSEVVGRPLPHRIVERRAGDAPVSYAATARAETLLGFRTSRGLRDMCASNWAFSGQGLMPA